MITIAQISLTLLYKYVARVPVIHISRANNANKILPIQL